MRVTDADSVPGADDTARALSVVWDVFGVVVAASSARVEIRHEDGFAGVVISVLPSNARACPVSVVALRLPLVLVTVGPKPTASTIELWAEEDEASLDRLRNVLDAVKSGQVRQHVQTYKRDRIRVTSWFDEFEYIDSTSASAPVTPGQEHALSFEPYDAATRP